MYQTHASLALLLVFIQYCCSGYSGYGRFWGFIISKEIKITQKHDTQFGHTVNV